MNKEQMERESDGYDQLLNLTIAVGDSLNKMLDTIYSIDLPPTETSRWLRQIAVMNCNLANLNVAYQSHMVDVFMPYTNCTKALPIDCITAQGLEDMVYRLIDLNPPAEVMAECYKIRPIITNWRVPGFIQ